LILISLQISLNQHFREQFSASLVLSLPVRGTLLVHAKLFRHLNYFVELLPALASDSRLLPSVSPYAGIRSRTARVKHIYRRSYIRSLFELQQQYESQAEELSSSRSAVKSSSLSWWSEPNTCRAWWWVMFRRAAINTSNRRIKGAAAAAAAVHRPSVSILQRQRDRDRPAPAPRSRPGPCYAYFGRTGAASRSRSSSSSSSNSSTRENRAVAATTSTAADGAAARAAGGGVESTTTATVDGGRTFRRSRGPLLSEIGHRNSSSVDTNTTKAPA
ncbi:unnamed protein product, partial [Laminaria digitata]